MRRRGKQTHGDKHKRERHCREQEPPIFRDKPECVPKPKQEHQTVPSPRSGREQDDRISGMHLAPSLKHSIEIVRRESGLEKHGACSLSIKVEMRIRAHLAGPL